MNYSQNFDPTLQQYTSVVSSRQMGIGRKGSETQECNISQSANTNASSRMFYSANLDNQD